MVNNSTMKIVAKSAKQLEAIENVPDEMKGILQRVWSGRGNDQDRSRANIFLKGVKKQDAWLECDCAIDVDGNTPCLTAFRKPKGGYGLRRMPHRINHGEDCIFHWDLSNNDGQESPDFLLFTSEEEKPVSNAQKSAARSRIHYPKKAKKDPLKEILNWLLIAGGLNTLDGTSVQAHDRIERLLAAARTIDIDADLSLEKIIWTLPDALIKGWARSELNKRQDAGLWPTARPLQGFLIVPVKKIEERVLHCEGDRKIYVRQPINHEGDPNCLPRLGIVAIRADASKIFPEMAYTIPVRFLRHDRRDDGSWIHYFDLFPVQDKTERQIADVLARIARRMRGKGPNGENVIVEKPLSLSVDLQCPSPDFIVRVGPHQAMIQLRKSSEPEYRSRKDAEKANLAMNLRDEDRIFIDDRTTLSTEACDELLERRIMGWLKGELHFV